MQWIEVSVPTRSDEIDDVCAQLAELGAGGMVVEDETDFQQFLELNHQSWAYADDALEAQVRGVPRSKFYLADDDDGRAQLAAIRAGIGRELTTTTVRDSDWENNWRQYYQPIETGERLVVVPEWLDAPADGRLPLRLDPGLIFGTGSHATTRMCLAALEHCAGADRTVLDLGCGSGILGIGALLLGCAHVTGCDIDPKAPEVAAANAALNGFYDDKFTVCAGDILADAGLRRRLGTGYDIVLANIVADVIIPLAALAPAFLAPGGTFVCSGIIDGREDEVAAAFAARLESELGLEANAPYNGESWDLISLTRLSEGNRERLRRPSREAAALDALPSRRPPAHAAPERKTPDASTAYGQLVLAGEKLSALIRRMQGRGARQQSRLARQINLLVKKFGGR